MTDLNEAISAQQSGDLETAEKLYLEYLERVDDFDDFNAKQLLGFVYSTLQKLDLAIQYMSDSLAQQPDQPGVENNIANCYKKLGQTALAITHYKKAISLQSDFADAYQNLASILQESGDLQESLLVIRKGLALHPKNPSLINLLGHVKKSSNDYQGAIECYQDALRIRPGHLITHHNLGVAYRLNNQPNIALEHYQLLVDQNLQNFELFQNIGNAYSDIGELAMAMECYNKVLELNPAYTDAHRNLSALMWSMGEQTQFVDSYEQVFSRGVINDELILACTESLLAAEQPEAAFEVLDKHKVAEPHNPNYLDFVARCHMEAGQPSRAREFHEHACKGEAASAHLLNFGIFLLRSGEVERAAKLLEQVFALEPDNQFAMSHLTLCWRLLGDEREARVNNYEQLVGAYHLPPPKGFSTITEFNQTLDKFLTEVHTTRHYPYEQSVRGGTQTHGNLLARDSEELRLLVESLSFCINQHLRQIANVEPPFPAFPRARHFDFSASWSVKLRSQGFHTMHVHPMGWFSSAYYVNLPDSMDQGNHEGWLKFGEPNFEPPQPLDAQFFIQPEPGKLALFPSYMWHGTVPFQADQARTTVVFDIVPVERY